ncbi:GNAT family N-acetyltransferase [Corticicoccus populi]|uniref:GNAT family N-acetyltransferase n=1 Tax=Corticicoccus populi TaxID=1812821 RepID=A0ABW5WY23_9STAP
MIEIRYEAPNNREYRELRRVCGLTVYSQEAAAKGLPNACHNVMLYNKASLIGMGRVVGDGGTVFQIVDIAVHPDYQGLGYGRKIMDEIMVFLDYAAEESTYVNLIADYPADKLYEQYGFKTTEPASTAMARRY